MSSVDYDGLGRKIRSSQAGACTGSGDAVTDTLYDGMGRVRQVSNPYCAGDSIVYTPMGYDALGRVTSVTQPDSAVTVTEYSGNLTTVSEPAEIVRQGDPAQIKRQSATDAMGRVTQVVENPGGTLSYITLYSYDLLDDLVQVCQNGALNGSGECTNAEAGVPYQVRTFTYDSLKRLLNATNPETGQISYTYDNSGNLLTRTDGRAIKTLSYDGINRLTGFSYSDGTTPAVSLTYDQDIAIEEHIETNYPIGRLVRTAAAGVSRTDYRYDALGRVQVSQQVPAGGSAYVFGYGYDLAGELTSMTYPSTRTLATSYDAAGRASSVGSYATDIRYAAHGGPSQMKLGTSNHLIEETCYNNRLQVMGIRVGAQASECQSQGTDLLSLGFGYYRTDATKNNGNLMSASIKAGGATFSQSYEYDSFSRLRSASEGVNGAAWSRGFGYDAFGNMWVNAHTGFDVDSFTPQTEDWYDPGIPPPVY